MLHRFSETRAAKRATEPFSEACDVRIKLLVKPLDRFLIKPGPLLHSPV